VFTSVREGLIFVSIEQTGYGWNVWRVSVRLPVGARFFSFPRRPGRFLGSPSLLSNGYRNCKPFIHVRPSRAQDLNRSGSRAMFCCFPQWVSNL
jgi:hypothetical protein